jgi:hypothetical protein
MVFGWLSWHSPLDFDERAERRLANRPRRGNRTKVKAARRATRQHRR